MGEIRTVRSPAVAGMFYPSDPAELKQLIGALTERIVRQKAKGRVRGIISPHAGYMYSGFTAAHGFSMLRGEEFDTVVVISPSHRDYFYGVSVYSGDAYATPLGVIEIDLELRKSLIQESSIIFASETGHKSEHALEVQLPFLQEVLPPFKLLPLVIGDQSHEVCLSLGEALGRVLVGKNILMVASTDLSHFHPADVAYRIDEVMMNDVRRFDYEHLMQDLETGRTEACGGGPAVAVMSALKQLGARHMDVLHYSTSGDVTGDYTSVVGYLSAVAYV
jgi:AmmeMemoRadiSam system protein B